VNPGLTAAINSSVIYATLFFSNRNIDYVRALFSDIRYKCFIRVNVFSLDIFLFSFAIQNKYYSNKYYHFLIKFIEMSSFFLPAPKIKFYFYTEKNVLVKPTKRSNQNGILVKLNRISDYYNHFPVFITRNSICLYQNIILVGHFVGLIRTFSSVYYCN